jgi:hypothetical protein
MRQLELQTENENEMSMLSQLTLPESASPFPSKRVHLLYSALGFGFRS